MADSKDSTNHNPSHSQRARGTIAYINTSHIKHNLNVFKQLHAGKIIAVVKADAYGHGITHVVPALSDCDAFAVATIEEALELRGLDANKKILLLEGVFNSSEMEAAIENEIDVVIHQDYQIRLLETVDLSADIDVWLKVDSGMNRLGFRPEEIDLKLAELKAISSIQTIRLMAHFASSEVAIDSQTKDQIICNKKLKSLGYEYSFSNTCGVLNGLTEHDEWARVGLGLFGVSQLGNDETGFGLKPAMRLTAKVIATKFINAGSHVGYGGHFVAKNDMRIAVLGIGYADGYPWSEYSSFVRLDGIRLPIIGRVSMDMMTIDVSVFKQNLTGKEVTIWGDDVPIEAVANDLNLIPYALVCGIKNRVKLNAIQ